MKKRSSMIMLATLISFLGGCPIFKKDTGKILIGTWSNSSYVSPAEAAKMSEGPIPEGASMEMSMTGNVTFHVGNKYNEDGEITLRLRRGDREAAFRFFVRDAGDWKIHDDVLVQTSVDSSMTALDQTTKEFIEANPELKAIVAPVKGESTSYKLKEISDSKVLLEEKEFGFTVIMQRKK